MDSINSQRIIFYFLNLKIHEPTRKHTPDLTNGPHARLLRKYLWKHEKKRLIIVFLWRPRTKRYISQNFTSKPVTFNKLKNNYCKTKPGNLHRHLDHHILIYTVQTEKIKQKEKKVIEPPMTE